MHIMQITKIRLAPGMDRVLSAFDFHRTNEWITQWTPVDHFKAVIADTREQALEMCKETLRKELVPRWLRGLEASNFEFGVSDQPVEDGRFWMSAQVTTLRLE